MSNIVGNFIAQQRLRRLIKRGEMPPKGQFDKYKLRVPKDLIASENPKIKQDAIRIVAEVAKGNDWLLGDLAYTARMNAGSFSLKSPDIELRIRMGCTNALGLAEDPRTINVLLEIFDANCLLKFSKGSKKALKRIVNAKPKESIDFLIKSLNKDKVNDDEYKMACKLIEQIYVEKIINIEDCIGLMCNEDLGSKIVGIGLLKASYDEQAMKILIWLLQNKHWRVSNMAEKKFGQINDSESIDKIIKLFNESNNIFIKENIIKALGETKNKSIIPFLLGNLSSITERVASALGEIGETQAVFPLIMHLADKSEFARRAVANALIKIGDPKGIAFAKVFYYHDLSYIENLVGYEKETLYLLFKFLKNTKLFENEKIEGENAREKIINEIIFRLGYPDLANLGKIAVMDSRYIQRIGLEKSIKIVNEYLEKIKNCAPKEELDWIKSELLMFIRNKINKFNNSKMIIKKLPKPSKFSKKQENLDFKKRSQLDNKILINV